MAPEAGFEPATFSLTANCSTAELLRIAKNTSGEHFTKQNSGIPDDYT